MAFSASAFLQVTPSDGSAPFTMSANGGSSSVPGTYEFIVQAMGQECVGAGFYNPNVYAYWAYPNPGSDTSFRTGNLSGVACPGGPGATSYTNVLTVYCNTAPVTVSEHIAFGNRFTGEIYAGLDIGLVYTPPPVIPPPVSTITTVPSATALTLGDSVSDTAFVQMVQSVWDTYGTIVLFFEVWRVGTPDVRLYQQAFEITGNGTYNSPSSYTPGGTGDYYWRAYTDVGGAGGDHEPFTVYATPPPTALSITTGTQDPVELGQLITDVATLINGASPTGTLTFTCYGPDDPTCGDPAKIAFTDTVAVSGNGVYESAPFTPTLPGLYRWVVDYSGDMNNDPITTICGATGEQAHVTASLTDVRCGDEFFVTQDGTDDIRVEQWRAGAAIDRRTFVIDPFDDRGCSCDFDGDGVLYFNTVNGKVYAIDTNTNPFDVRLFADLGFTTYNTHVDQNNNIYVCHADGANLYLYRFNRSGQRTARFDLPFPTTGAEGSQNDYTGGAISADGTRYYYAFGSVQLIKRYDLVNQAPLSDVAMEGGVDVFPTGIRFHPDGRVLVRTTGADVGILRVYTSDFASHTDYGDPDGAGKSDCQVSFLNHDVVYVTQAESSNVYAVNIQTAVVTSGFITTVGSAPNRFPMAVRCVSGGAFEDLVENPGSVCWAIKTTGAVPGGQGTRRPFNWFTG